MEVISSLFKEPLRPLRPKQHTISRNTKFLRMTTNQIKVENKDRICDRIITMINESKIFKILIRRRATAGGPSQSLDNCIRIIKETFVKSIAPAYCWNKTVTIK